MQLVHKEEEHLLLWGDVTPGVGGGEERSQTPLESESFSLTSADLVHVRWRMHVSE